MAETSRGRGLSRLGCQRRCPFSTWRPRAWPQTSGSRWFCRAARPLLTLGDRAAPCSWTPRCLELDLWVSFLVSIKYPSCVCTLCRISAVGFFA